MANSQSRLDISSVQVRLQNTPPGVPSLRGDAPFLRVDDAPVMATRRVEFAGL